MQIVIILILILLNAFFASAEIAFISLNDVKISKQAKDGNKKAQKIKNMLTNPSKFLATIQIGITLAGFLSSAFASDSYASKLAPLLYNVFPQISLSLWYTISIVVITIILSYFTLVFGELVPKRLAMKNPERIAFLSIGIIKTISVITAPFVKLLTFSTNIISKMFGVSETDEETVTEEEIRMMVDVGQEKGTIENAEKYMINNVFEFNDKIVSDIMIPTSQIIAIEKNMTIEQVIKKLSENFKYSRIPVYNETIDKIEGIVYVKDILLSIEKKEEKISTLVKDAYFVSEALPIDELFAEMRKNRKQIAIVIDKLNNTSGIVTMEDILEEIVGEIYDEYDSIETMFKKINNTTFVFNGNIALYEVENILNVKVNDNNFETLSDFLTNKLGKVPNTKDIGTSIETEKIRYTIDKVKNKKIVQVTANKIN